MFEKVLISNQQGDNSLNFQVNGDVTLLLTRKNLQVLLDDIKLRNMFACVGSARKTADNRQQIVDNRIIDNLLNIEKSLGEKLYEALQQPSVIKTIFKIQNSYVFEGNDKKLSLLLKMLENRIFAEDLDAILIDDCIDIVSEITSKQIDLLKFKYSHENYNKDFDSFSELDDFFQNRYKNISDDFLTLSEFDLEYLIYKKLLEKTGIKIIDWENKKRFSVTDIKCIQELENKYQHIESYITTEKDLKLEMYELTPLSNKLASLIVESERI